MMRHVPRPPRPAILAILAIVVAGLAVTALASRPDPARKQAQDAHALVGRVPKDQMDRILRAVDAITTETSRNELVAQGRRLFRTTQGVRQGEACAACHVEGGGANAAVGTITHGLPGNPGGFLGARDPLSLWGIAQTAPYGWDGHEPSLEAFAVGTVQTHFKNREGSTDADQTARDAAAIAAYLRTLRPPTTDFDRGTLSPAARRGEALFVGKGACSACHGGPLLTDNALHNTGVPMLKVGTQDSTDFGAASSGPLKGAFDTPQLRDVRNTAPYMHNGSLKTLREVVEFYNLRSTLSPLRLTNAEIDDLVAYLESL